MILRSLVQPVFDGPIDIVGDVHGYIDELHDLLFHLGYDQSGFHPEGRRLVFLGDLVDGGPDSPAAARMVRQLVAAGRAQCVLGNHDFNVLRMKKNPESDWFFEPAVNNAEGSASEVPADDKTRKMIPDFFWIAAPCAGGRWAPDCSCLLGRPHGRTVSRGEQCHGSLR